MMPYTGKYMCIVSETTAVIIKYVALIAVNERCYAIAVWPYVSYATEAIYCLELVRVWAVD